MRRDSLSLEHLRMFRLVVDETSKALTEAEARGMDHIIVDIGKLGRKDPEHVVGFLSSVLRVAGFEIGTDESLPLQLWVYRHPESREVKNIVLAGHKTTTLN